MKCKQCEAELKPDAQFCVMCGTPVEAEAGADLPGEAVLAPNESEEAAAVAQTEQPQPAVPEEQNTNAAPQPLAPPPRPVHTEPAPPMPGAAPVVPPMAVPSGEVPQAIKPQLPKPKRHTGGDVLRAVFFILVGAICLGLAVMLFVVGRGTEPYALRSWSEIYVNAGITGGAGVQVQSMMRILLVAGSLCVPVLFCATGLLLILSAVRALHAGKGGVLGTLALLLAAGGTLSAMLLRVAESALLITTYWQPATLSPVDALNITLIQIFDVLGRIPVVTSPATWGLVAVLVAVCFLLPLSRRGGRRAQRRAAERHEEKEAHESHKNK